MTAEGPGVRLIELTLGQSRVLRAHRRGDELIVEAMLRRDGRPFLVPFVLCYAPAPSGGWALRNAYAGASAVTTLDDGHLILSDRPSEQKATRGHSGRALWRHRPEEGLRLVLSTPRDVVSYYAVASVIVAAVWMHAEARTTREDAELREELARSGLSATMVHGDLWPESSYQMRAETLRLVRIDPDHSDPEILPLPLPSHTRLTGELAMTPDGGRCAAGVVRFLPGGHRRHGLLLFAPTDPRGASSFWHEDDLTAPVASPDGAWFACTAERVAVPGRGPRQGVVLVAADSSRSVRVARLHPDWLQPAAWAAPDVLLCTGEQNGLRRLWRVHLEGGRPEPVELGGSVDEVTVTAGEALVVRSRVDLPSEVVALRADRPASVPEPLIAPASAVAPAGRVERLTHHAPDGSKWHSRLCLPAHDPGHALPVLIWCHGGPLLSWTNWSWRWNPWPFVTEGYAVLMLDPPLSLGYGQDAVERGWGRWTSGVAAVAAGQVRDALNHPALDGNRVAAMGGSFGGYLALALGTLLPEIHLIAAHCGWADFAAVARACDLHWHWLREYGPIETSPTYRRESLDLTRIDPGVTVLLSHGCGDTHVPVGETRAMYRSLESRGVDVRLMLLPDERHSIEKPANVAAWYRWVLEACRTALAPRPARKEQFLR
ncbi:S9 family peptidase [Sphaerisporangium album]|nr:prolyl oligopeptidase family serine peptidase [Sphaerisporangium album]